jgi:hypothetical protein
VLAVKDGFLMPQVSVNDIMSGDWIYTVFDEWWRPSDRTEDALSKVESNAGLLFEALHTSAKPPTDQQWVDLCIFLALIAYRHPEVMRRGHLRSKEMAWAIADVASHQPLLSSPFLRTGRRLLSGVEVRLSKWSIWQTANKRSGRDQSSSVRIARSSMLSDRLKLSNSLGTSFMRPLQC